MPIKKVTDHLGNEYKSQWLMLEKYHTTLPTYHRRKRQGWPLDEILELPPIDPDHSAECKPEYLEKYKRRRAEFLAKRDVHMEDLHTSRTCRAVERDALNEQVKKVCKELIKQYTADPARGAFSVERDLYQASEALVFRAVVVNKKTSRYMFMGLEGHTDLFINLNFYKAFDSSDFLAALKAFSMTGLNSKEKIPHGLAVFMRSCGEIWPNKFD